MTQPPYFSDRQKGTRGFGIAKRLRSKNHCLSANKAIKPAVSQQLAADLTLNTYKLKGNPSPEKEAKDGKNRILSWLLQKYSCLTRHILDVNLN